MTDDVINVSYLTAFAIVRATSYSAADRYGKPPVAKIVIKYVVDFVMSRALHVLRTPLSGSVHFIRSPRRPYIHLSVCQSHRGPPIDRPMSPLNLYFRCRCRRHNSQDGSRRQLEAGAAVEPVTLTSGNMPRFYGWLSAFNMAAR